jgi:hypothetical protein
MLKSPTCPTPGTRAVREGSIVDDSDGAEYEAGPNDYFSGPGYAGIPGSGWEPEKNYLIMKTVAAEHGDLFGAESAKG